MVTFLQRYYPGLQGAYFHDTHLKPDAGFVGYWSFVAAAVVVLREINDRGFADNIFYPAGLASHRRDRQHQRARVAVERRRGSIV